jgi:hypothetical protein
LAQREHFCLVMLSCSSFVATSTGAKSQSGSTAYKVY